MLLKKKIATARFTDVRQILIFHVKNNRLEGTKRTENEFFLRGKKLKKEDIK